MLAPSQFSSRRAIVFLLATLYKSNISTSTLYIPSSSSYNDINVTLYVVYSPTINFFLALI